MTSPKRRFALAVVQKLQRAGFQALWAGGCVRDLLLGIESDDYDVATDARPQQVRRLFRRTVAVGASFGVILVRGRGEQGQVEVATFRTEGAYSDGRHPDQVQFSTAEADARRRDFTINGMFYDPVRKQLLDFVGGQDDLRRRLLRAIGDPRQRFGEDKLRLLRAVRFAARFGYAIEAATAEALGQMAPQITVVSPERIQHELRRMLEHATRATALRLAHQYGLLQAIMPELAWLHGPSPSGPGTDAGDLWGHTLHVIELLGRSWRTTAQRLALEAANPEPAFPLVLAALLHHVDCPETGEGGGGPAAAGGHQRPCGRLANQAARRLRLSNAERERLVWLVQHHGSLTDAPQMRPARLKRILVQPGIAELLALHRADAAATGADAGPIDYCEHLLCTVPAEQLDPEPLITGHDLIRMGLKPGPMFKQLLEQVRDAQLDGTVQTKRQATALVRRLVRERRA